MRKQKLHTTWTYLMIRRKLLLVKEILCWSFITVLRNRHQWCSKKFFFKKNSENTEKKCKGSLPICPIFLEQFYSRKTKVQYALFSAQFKKLVQINSYHGSIDFAYRGLQGRRWNVEVKLVHFCFTQNQWLSWWYRANQK